MHIKSVIIWLWIIFLVYWFANVRKVKPVAEPPDRAEHWRYSRFILIALALFIFRFPPLNLVLLPHSPLWNGLGLAACAAGLGLAIWARRTLAGNWSARVVLKENHELIQHGPYAFVRHPIYTAILLMIAGSALASGRLGTFLGALALFVSFWIKLRQEEALMLKHFPESYAAYKKRVKALIPFVV